jgi:GNAT superfamily N-acetyltransferase
MKVIDFTPEYMRFVATCTHTDDTSDEQNELVRVREKWLKDTLKRGLIVKIALDDNGEPIGFAHCLPIELGTWGMSGKDLMTVPCLTLRYKKVYEHEQGSGAGRALMEAVEQEARKTKKGVAVLCYDSDFWFMPLSFFEKLGYKEVARRGETVIALKTFAAMDLPVMHKSRYKFKAVPGKVVVDVFWCPMCGTCVSEIHNFRTVCAEFGDRVILNEYNTGEKAVLDKYQITRALFFNGKSCCWGYEAPREEIRKEIEKALQEIDTR